MFSREIGSTTKVYQLATLAGPLGTMDRLKQLGNIHNHQYASGEDRHYMTLGSSPSAM